MGRLGSGRLAAAAGLMQEGILTVSALTEQLRRNIEGRFPFVWVRGEVGNLSRPASGHVYFSLKDNEAQLQCVWFRSHQRQGGAGENFDPLTGEVYEHARPSPLELLRNGLDLLCAGRIAVYAARGQYQLVVELAQPAGEGQLALALEERKRRLSDAGYFARERKRTLPRDPLRVALVTSPDGAAVHDFLELARNRGSGAHIRLFPVAVQGGGAAPEIAATLREINRQGWAQVIVLIRGGGSLEDLWAFNEECLVEAVFRSDMPVLAGIGHEIDVCLVDMTADLRAATPSHAAQLLWPARSELWKSLDEAGAALLRGAQRGVSRVESQLREYERILQWRSPAQQHSRLSVQLEHLAAMFFGAAFRWLADKRSAWERLESRRRAALTPDGIQALLTRLDWLNKALDAAMARHGDRAEHELALLQERLPKAAHALADAAAHRHEKLHMALESFNPLAPLSRGYALVRTMKGRLLRSVKQAEPGQEVEIRTSDGYLSAEIRRIRPVETRR